MLRTLLACLGLICLLANSAVAQPRPTRTAKAKQRKHQRPGPAQLSRALATARPGQARRPERTRNPWARVRAPAAGKADAIGTYTAGCLRGAASLPLAGLGFRVMHPLRRFGHPMLVGFVEQLGRRARAGGLEPIAVGDLGQPRGGPAPRGHASHQIGLDADIWYVPPRRAFFASRLSGQVERVSVIDRRRGRLSARWAGRVQRLLELAAADARVAKILVNPAIKRSLCESVRGDRSWLGKLQPWWGHDRHFHVQLTCPADSSSCRANPPLPRGDGCEQMEWWFSPLTLAQRHARRAAYRARVGTRRGLPALPEQCAELLPPALYGPPTTSSAAARRRL